MPFTKKTYRVLSGSLNLLPPGGEIPEDGARNNLNCRVDQQGQLKKRGGSTKVNPASVTSPTDVHSLIRMKGRPNIFMGAGAKLFENNGATAIHSTFDGQPLSAVSLQKYLWVMNRNGGRKHDPARTPGTTQAWTPPAPTQAPTAAAGAQESKDVAGFDNPGEQDEFEVLDADSLIVWPTSAESLAKYPDTADPPVHWDTVTKIDTSTTSLRIKADPAGFWVATRRYVGSQDFSIDGQQRDDDRFRFYLAATDPTAIVSVTVSFDVNTGFFDLDYYVAEIPLAMINQVRVAWNEIEVRRAFHPRQGLAGNARYQELLRDLQEVERQINAASDDEDAFASHDFEFERQQLVDQIDELRGTVQEKIPTFSRVGSTAGKDWETVVAFRVNVKVKTPTFLYFDEATIRGGVGANLSGDYEWYVTNENEDGHESSPSPVSNTLTLAIKPATLSGIEVSLDSQTVKRHIYRGGGTLGAIYRSFTINDNVTTSATDDNEDDALTSLGQIMAIDHDPAPDAREVIGPYFGRLIAYSTEANKNRWFWTPVNKPYYFPAGNFNDIGSTESELLVVTHHKLMLFFYAEDSIWRVDGDPGTRGVQRETNATMGVIGPRAVAVAGEIDYFCGPDGIYLHDGYQANKVSKPLDPIFKNESVDIGNELIPPLSGNVDARARSVMHYSNNQLYFSYAEQGEDYPSVTLVLDTELGRWARWKMASGISSIQGFRSMLHDSHQNALYGALRNGFFYRLNRTAVFTDDGNNYQFKYQSRFHDQGFPDNDKRFQDVVVKSNTDGKAVTLNLHWDDGESNTAVASLATDGPPGEQIFDLGSNGIGLRHRNVSVELDGTTSGPISVDDIAIHFYLEPRESLSYDSQSLDFGTKFIKHVEEVEFDIEQLGQLNWRIETDRPGNDMTSRVSPAFSGNAGRKTVRFDLSVLAPADTVEGINMRLLITAFSPVAFRLYGVALKIRPIGVWLDGANGDTYETEELDLVIAA